MSWKIDFNVWEYYSKWFSKFNHQIKLMKDNLETEVEYKSKGTLIICRIQWYKEGEIRGISVYLETCNYNNIIEEYKYKGTLIRCRI